MHRLRPETAPAVCPALLVKRCNSAKVTKKLRSAKAGPNKWLAISSRICCIFTRREWAFKNSVSDFEVGVQEVSLRQSYSRSLVGHNVSCYDYECLARCFCLAQSGASPTKLPLSVKIQSSDENVPRHLPKKVCLCRVGQEALHNASSTAIRRRVPCGAERDGGQGPTEDHGYGCSFNVEEVKKSRGLGLVSMQERVHLVHGKFHIESRSGMGTKIIAGVPVSPASAA